MPAAEQRDCRALSRLSIISPRISEPWIRTIAFLFTGYNYIINQVNLREARSVLVSVNPRPISRSLPVPREQDFRSRGLGFRRCGLSESARISPGQSHLDLNVSEIKQSAAMQKPKNGEAKSCKWIKNDLSFESVALKTCFNFSNPA